MQISNEVRSRNVHPRVERLNKEGQLNALRLKGKMADKQEFKALRRDVQRIRNGQGVFPCAGYDFEVWLYAITLWAKTTDEAFRKELEKQTKNFVLGFKVTVPNGSPAFQKAYYSALKINAEHVYGVSHISFKNPGKSQANARDEFASACARFGRDYAEFMVGYDVIYADTITHEQSEAINELLSHDNDSLNTFAEVVSTFEDESNNITNEAAHQLNDWLDGDFKGNDNAKEYTLEIDGYDIGKFSAIPTGKGTVQDDEEQALHRYAAYLVSTGVEKIAAYKAARVEIDCAKFESRQHRKLVSQYWMAKNSGLKPTSAQTKAALMADPGEQKLLEMKSSQVKKDDVKIPKAKAQRNYTLSAMPKHLGIVDWRQELKDEGKEIRVIQVSKKPVKDEALFETAKWYNEPQFVAAPAFQALSQEIEATLRNGFRKGINNLYALHAGIDQKEIRSWVAKGKSYIPKIAKVFTTQVLGQDSQAKEERLTILAQDEQELNTFADVDAPWFTVMHECEAQIEPRNGIKLENLLANVLDVIARNAAANATA